LPLQLFNYSALELHFKIHRLRNLISQYCGHLFKRAYKDFRAYGLEIELFFRVSIIPNFDSYANLQEVGCQYLAAAKQTAEPAQKEGLVRKAKKMFEVTLQSLPDTAKISEACSKLLPLILKALGM
jgi:hypothetical protein